MLDGSLSKSTSFTAVKVLPPPTGPLKIKWKEGAIVANEDTNEVFRYHDGKLVPDPAFSKKTAEETTQRRLLFLGCFVIAGGGISYWILKRRRLKTGVASGA
jgi:hypothetical protein